MQDYHGASSMSEALAQSSKAHDSSMSGLYAECAKDEWLENEEKCTILMNLENV